jgi:polyferredoxin
MTQAGAEAAVAGPQRRRGTETTRPAAGAVVPRMARVASMLLIVGALLVALTTAIAAQGDAGEWDFPDDEEDVASWSDDLRTQAVDLGLLAAFGVLAFFSFFRKSVRLKYATLVLAVLYLGFYKSQLISIVNIFGLAGGGLPIVRHNLAWYLLAAVVVASTVLWGRVYCGRICAFGALTQLIDRVAPRRWQITVPRALERRAGFIKYGILGGALAWFLVTGDSGIYPYIEPFWMFGMHATPVLWVGLGTLLVASIFVRNLYCRFLCPVGAALGLLSSLTVFRIRRWSECRTCRICEKTCEWGAIRGPKIVLTECVRCDDCERLYADTNTCPHHLIPIRRSRLEAEGRLRGGIPVISSGAAAIATATEALPLRSPTLSGRLGTQAEPRTTNHEH